MTFISVSVIIYYILCIYYIYFFGLISQISKDQAMADANSTPSSEPAQQQNEHIVPNVNTLPTVENFTQEELFEISDELFREWSDNEECAQHRLLYVSSIQSNDQQQDKPTVSNVNTLSIVGHLSQDDLHDLHELSDVLFREWSDNEESAQHRTLSVQSNDQQQGFNDDDQRQAHSEDFPTVAPHDNEELIDYIPHLNDLLHLDAHQSPRELGHYWFECNDKEILMKCFILHFIGLFGKNGATLRTLRG